MRCYNCGAKLTEKEFCTNCGADVSRYKKLICFSNYYYNEGLSKANVRDLSGAVESLKQCLAINKNHIAARNLLGLVYFEMGEQVAALSEWVISKNLRPNKNIADDYLNAIQKSPAQLEAINQKSKKFNIALNFCYQNNKDLAILQLKKILSDSPNYVQAHLLLALLYMDAGEWERARRELDRCLKIDRGNTMALRYMQEVDPALRREEEGRGARRQKSEEVVKYRSGNELIIQPVNVKEPKKGGGWILGLIAGIAIGVAAVWFLILPARENAVREEMTVRQTELGDEVDRRNTEISRLTQQVESLQNEKPGLEEELEELDGVNGRMGSIEMLLNAVYVYLKSPSDTEQLSAAMEQVDVDVIRNASTPEVVRNLYSEILGTAGEKLAQSYYDTGYNAYRAQEYETAVENLERAVLYDAENAQALYALGLSYMEKGDTQKAVETFQKVVEQFPGTQRASQAQAYVSQLEAD